MWLLLIVTIACLALLLAYVRYVFYRSGSVPTTESSTTSAIPIAVNFHFSRECNYGCGFCFHTETNKNRLPHRKVFEGLAKLKQAGMLKINFAGTNQIRSHSKLIGSG